MSFNSICPPRLKGSLEADGKDLSPFLVSMMPGLRYIMAYEPSKQLLFEYCGVELPGEQSDDENDDRNSEKSSDSVENAVVAPDAANADSDDALYG